MLRLASPLPRSAPLALPLLLTLGAAAGCASDGAAPDQGAPLPDLSASGTPDAAADLLTEPDLAEAPPDLIPPVYHRAPARAEMAFGFDSTSNTVVLFGGDESRAAGGTRVPRYRDDTWLFDVASAAWRTGAPRGPTARGRAAFAFDPAGRRLLVHGGRARDAAAGSDEKTGYTLLADTWVWSAAADTWAPLPTKGDPPPRAGGVAVWDAARSRLVLFGGSGDDVYRKAARDLGDPARLLGDTWQLLGDTWSKVATKGDAPPARHLAAVTLDDKRGRMVVAGGCCDGKGLPLGDVWALELQSDTWVRLFAADEGPNGRIGQGAGYDRARDRVVLFGGRDESVWALHNDASAFDGDLNYGRINSGDLFENPVLGCGGDPTAPPFDFVIAIPGSPERRERALMLSLGDRLLIAGGDGDCGPLDDTHLLELGRFTTLIPPATGQSCLRDGINCPCLCQ